MCKRRLCMTLCVGVLLLLGASTVCGFTAQGDPTLVGWWKFNEGTGTTARDAGGYGNDGTLNGGPSWVVGNLGGALEFDGSDDYVDCGSDASLDLTTWTIAFWLNLNQNKNYNAYIVKGLDAAENFEVLTYGVGNFHFPILFEDGARGFSNTANGVSIVGEWAHYAYTYDASEGRRFYKNGALIFEDTESRIPQVTDEPLIIGNEAGMSRFVDGIMDDVRIYSRVLTVDDLPDVILGKGPNTELADDPSPENEASDILRDTVLTWTPGEFAAAHDVYIGTVFADVNDADRANPGDALVSQDQTGATFDAGRLELGRTYYWRIDEVNAAPDSTIFKGEVWSFTVEPLAYPVAGVVATSNGVSEPGVGPENTVNGSGLNDNDEHSTNSADMWLAVPGADPLQLQYDFDRIYKLHQMLVWNYNVQFELMLGFGVKDVSIEYSADGADWTALGDVQLAQASAKADYAANTAVPFNGVPAKYVRLAVNSGYGPIGQFGLSEVRFLFIPAHAREPQPTDGQTGVDVNPVLSWRAGREAAAHDVYLGAAADAIALADSVDTAEYTPADLEFGTTYYWKIDEINEVQAIAVWEGDIWSFATQQFAVIDDMESYDDEENRIFDNWLDGFVNDTGSTVGYFEAPFAEQTIVNSGSQSMPLEYNNADAPFYSEAEYDLGSLNLDTNGADTLRLFVSGQAPAFLETADGSILMNAIGTDIWDNADEFRYVYKTLTGNGSMIARVDDLDGAPSGWAKAGVMVRQSTAGGSTHSFMCMTGGDGNGASWQGRLTDSASSENTDATDPVAPPYWVRVDRAGDSLTGFISPDGQTWTQIGAARTIAMTDPVLIGLALTSHNSAQATSAAFSNLSTTGDVTGNWQVAEIGAAQPVGNDVAPLYVALEDTSGNVAVVTHPDANIVGKSGWNEWLIPYSDLVGVNLGRVAIVYIGVGDRDNPTADGTGLIFIDDVGYGKPAPAAE